MVPFRVVEKELVKLHNKLSDEKFQTHYPFWRLQNDNVWELENAEHIIPNISGDVKVTDLRNPDVKGGLLENDYQQIQSNEDLATEIILVLLAKIGQEIILYGIGIAEEKIEHIVSIRKKRSEKFRKEILSAYDSSCAICNFSIRDYQENLLGIQAAHIMWHSDGGPDKVINGLALCSIHHELFDGGAFTLDSEHPESEEYQVVIATDVSGSGYSEWLARYNRKPVENLPDNLKEHPEVSYLKWHHREIFMSPELISKLPSC